MRIKLAILTVLLAPVLLSGCEFCRKKKADPAKPGAEATAAEKDMAGGEAMGAPMSAPPKMKSWGGEYADFVEWYEGASTRFHRAPPAVEIEEVSEEGGEKHGEEGESHEEEGESHDDMGESHEGGEEDHDEMGGD